MYEVSYTLIVFFSSLIIVEIISIVLKIINIPLNVLKKTKAKNVKL